MPNTTSKFHLYSDMSKFAMGSTLYQIQNGKPKLIAYGSKRLPEATKSYSITELKLCRLAINIAGFSHLLKELTLMPLMIIYLSHILSRVKQSPPPQG